MMRTLVIAGRMMCAGLTLFAAAGSPAQVIIDHTCTDLSQVPAEYVAAAQSNLRVHYAHRSHGSQINAGLELIEANTGAYNVAVELQNLPSEAGALCVYTCMPGTDYPYDYDYFGGVQALLNGLPALNVSIFSWCVELNDWSEEQVNQYLSQMSALEAANPGVRFVYMTGNAQGENHNRHARNEQIRGYCRANGKILYDFGDLDCWFNGEQHTEGGIPVEHPAYAGDYAGTHVNEASCVNKANAFWWMAAILAGWQGGPGPTPTPTGPQITLRADKQVFSAAYDTITVFATVQACANFTPYVRIASPDGAFYYLTSGGGIVPGGAGGGAPYMAGPLTLGSAIADYQVAAFEFSDVAPGTYQLQGALVGSGGIIGGIYSTDLIVQ